jgi:hypothetical protein
MDINKGAPVVAAGEIEVAADPETVWVAMAGIDRWPAWNPDVKSAHLEGELADGSTFRWKAGPGTIVSTLQQVEQPRTLAWTGNTFGIKAVHVWRLEPKGDRTIVRTEESWEGLLPHIFRGSMQRMLQRSIDAGLLYLKAEAEKKIKPLNC